jgi:hypothetical protein
MLVTFPSFDPPTKALHRLASASLAPATFRAACEQFAQYNPASSGDNLWHFTLGAPEPNLLVGVDVEPTGRKKPNGWPEFRHLKVNCAILSICWWETFTEVDHASAATFAAEEATFHAIYADTLKKTVADIGYPLLQGVDTNCYFHHWAIWRGETALLILQESSYDVQFGLDINFWIRPWSSGNPQPTSPLIDWVARE